MIPSGLKVGQTYLENNMVYKVTKVLDDGRYEGTWTGATSSMPLAVEEPEEKAEKKSEELEEDYLSMPYAQLKKLCADRGLDAKGSKADLIARLEK